MKPPRRVLDEEANKENIDPRKGSRTTSSNKPFTGAAASPPKRKLRAARALSPRSNDAADALSPRSVSDDVAALATKRSPAGAPAAATAAAPAAPTPAVVSTPSPADRR